MSYLDNSPSTTTFKCPLCEEDIPLNGIFLSHKPGEVLPRPIICVRCLRGLYRTLPEDDGNRKGYQAH